MLRLIVLTALLASAAFATQSQEEPGADLCYASLPVQSSSEIPLHFQSQLLFESDVTGSGGNIEIVNKSNKGIRYYVVIIEFLDSDGKYTVSVPVYNVAEKGHTVPLDVPFKPWLLANWPGSYMAPIGAGEQSSKTFHTVISTLTCPASARVSMVQLRYDDGTEFKYVSPRLNLLTAPTASPLEISDSQGAKRWLPLTVFGTLQVDSEGRVRILDLDFAATGFKRWLEKEFSHWNFTPPRMAGEPATATLSFLFVLGDSADMRVQVTPTRRQQRAQS